MPAGYLLYDVRSSVHPSAPYDSSLKGNTMKTAPKKAPILLSCFLLPMCLMVAVFAAAGICPFGSRSLGVMDMSHQYLAMLYSLRDILSGDASMLYLPSMALGGNMMGVAAYYLMSPLNLIVCLFSRERLYLAVSLLYFLRVGLCGLTMAIYCGHRRGYGWRLLVPALAYGFMAYMLANAFNYLWHDCVILLPLVALGIFRLTQGKGCWLYVISLAGALVINFYLGYILCLFSVLFFLYELLCAHQKGEGAPWKRLLTFALSSLAAGALGAVILLPAFMSLAGGKAGFDPADLALTAKFPFVTLFSKLFPGAFNYEEIMPVGMPHIFCGTVVTALTVLYFADGRVSRRRRILTGCLFAVLALSFWVSALDLVWHGMNVPSWYNYRYSFLFSFLMIAAGDAALADIRTVRPRQFMLPPIVIAVLGLLAFAGRTYDYVSWTAALAAVATAAAACAGLWLAIRPQTAKRVAALMGALVLLLHIGELGANAQISLKALTVPSSDPAAWEAYVLAKGAAFDLLDTADAFVRVESPDSFDMDRCEPMLFGYDGLSHYSSNTAQKNLDLLDRLGLDRYTDLYALYGPGVTAGTDSFLGVGYVVASGLNKPYAAIASAGTYHVFENPYALPIAFSADGAMAETLTAPDSFGYIQGLYDAAAPEVGEEIYTPAAVEDVASENYSADGNRYILSDGAGSGSVTYTLTARADGPMYGEIELADFPGVMVFVNDAFSGMYATAQVNGSLYLGDFLTGDSVIVRLQAAVDITVEHAAFATENARALAAYHDAIAPGGCDLTKRTNAHYTGSFTTGENDSLLVLTVPYDPAWRITVDGEAVEAVEIQDCLTAIPVRLGQHTLEMRYVPAGLIPGACISALALAVCIGITLPRRVRRRSGE